MKYIMIVISVALFLGVYGCSELDIRNTDEILKTPLGDAGLSLGMSRSKVEEMYGKPDLVSTVVSDEWKEPRTQWFYRARYGALPVNAGYLSEDLYLYFDGDNLTNISKKPLGKRQVAEDDDMAANIK